MGNLASAICIRNHPNVPLKDVGGLLTYIITPPTMDFLDPPLTAVVIGIFVGTATTIITITMTTRISSSSSSSSSSCSKNIGST